MDNVREKFGSESPDDKKIRQKKMLAPNFFQLALCIGKFHLNYLLLKMLKLLFFIAMVVVGTVTIFHISTRIIKSKFIAFEIF